MLQISNFKLINSGFLIASFDVIMPKMSQFTIRNCAYFEKGNTSWVTLPSKEYEKDGKKRYYPYVAFPNKDINEKFLDEIKKEVKKVVGAL